MNSQKIVDYVMNTPYNTNPVILKQMIDANSSGGSGVTSWNDLKDKPFYATEERVLIAKSFAHQGVGGPFTGALPEYGTNFSGQYVLSVSALIPGDTYIAIVNEKEYIGIAESCEDTSSDNNMGINLFYHGEHPEDFSDAPISLGSYSNSMYISFENEGVSYDVELYHNKTVVKTLDPKYLPSDISISWNNLEDKPFGETIEKHYLLEETEITTNLTELSYPKGFKPNGFKENDAVIIKVGDTIYESALKYKESSTMPGDYDIYVGNLQHEDCPVCVHLYYDVGNTIISVDENVPLPTTISVYVSKDGIKTLDPKYLPKPVVADATGETVTGAEFNALLAALRSAGYLAT